jgi:hypothetical protein
MRAVKALWLVPILLFAALVSARADAPTPRVISVYGDSLGVGVWSGLYTVLKPRPQDSVLNHANVGGGITQPDFPTWLTDLGQQLDKEHPSVAIFIAGANDEKSIRDSGKSYLFKSEGWKLVYAQRLDAIYAECAKRKVPVMRRDDLTETAALLDVLFSDAAARAHATYLPLYDAFKGPDGAFASHLPDESGHLKLVRHDDGVHFTAYGYELIARRVLPTIDKLTLPDQKEVATAPSAPASASPAQ